MNVHIPRGIFGAFLTGEAINFSEARKKRQEQQPLENVEKRIYQGQPSLVKKFPDIVNVTADDIKSHDSAAE